ncbi:MULTISPECIES: AlkA N-terminal domain-containing protein [Shewanella]|uniref:DNA-3-methyladenine glycosylase 2 family protein n=2 Tax=Shewanellaceae TaxID=267890 RepID=UPI000C3CF9BA|nr:MULTISPECIES: AlkA N-terminal domain-containing protein [Shewanella]NCQ47002.1 helix-turn-helix domain-containing protein [Shewanella frigidimarina]NCO72916.1 helix-turn-helix domain-containing protein [Shewanella vesiculosa]NCP38620.1 helix-turn-helix domain-containing protein [Shewanella vesiculosa]NCP71335.1 helix-turn-helix domain-containing protein [Shewanella vesiculosa]NCP76272.1 helix-turn-helix domain-containing protein [Shewanella vesiculosa]
MVQINSDCNITAQICQQARLSRDARFDGQFFTGVLTTGIYCRSICPAPAPYEKNVRYFDSAIKAANAGLRPCLRCRPDSAPSSFAWLGTQTTLMRAIKLIEQGFLSGDNAGTVESLAQKLGISSRYLHKLFNQGMGTSPKRFALYQQLMFAKQLLHQTQLSMTEVAMAAGFNSIRRFNEFFKQQLLLTPSDLRQKSRGSTDDTHSYNDNQVRTYIKPITLALSYRPPLSWSKMLAFYAFRQVDNMEVIDDELGRYGRTFSFDGVDGFFYVSPNIDKPQLDVSIYLLDANDIKSLHHIVLQLRRMFDLDADMVVIRQALLPIITLGAQIDSGLRIPATGSVFEAACRAVLGQQVSVLQATKLLNLLVKHYGTTLLIDGKTWRLFPTPETIAAASLDELNMPGARKLALNALGKFVHQHADSTPDDWLEVKGIGPWTVAYAKMRGLSDPDMFLSSDLVIKKRLYALHEQAGQSIETPKSYLSIAADMTKQASPWGSYLTFQLWDYDPIAAKNG